jgi:hypothetical protein
MLCSRKIQPGKPCLNKNPVSDFLNDPDLCPRQTLQNGKEAKTVRSHETNICLDSRTEGIDPAAMTVSS